MKIGIVDADLLDHGTRHPNLALMKISGWLKGIHKKDGEVVTTPRTEYSEVRLLLESDFANALTAEELVGPSGKFDKLYISKVFDFSKLPELLETAWQNHRDWFSAEVNEDPSGPRIIFGGTGFIPQFGHLPPDLPNEIEHHFPDYDLYRPFLEQEKAAGKKMGHYKDYIDYSIGFATRGCFRHCAFCVNRNYTHVRAHSSIDEFYDPSRKHIYLWDDNFLGLIDHAEPGTRESCTGILQKLEETGKSFQFRQGLDIRLMTHELAAQLAACHYHGDFIFAFDHYSQKQSVVLGLRKWKTANPTSIPKFYVLCGFRNAGREVDDVLETMKRLRILMQFGALPYIMRHSDFKQSPFMGLYTQLARWCNQPQFFKKKSFREFVEANQFYHAQGSSKKQFCASMEALQEFESSSLTSKDGQTTQQISKEFFDLRWDAHRHDWETGGPLIGEPDL